MNEHDPDGPGIETSTDTSTDAVDELGSWEDDDLVRALRAPGLESELADQERYVDAYRAAGLGTVTPLAADRAGRTARRLGAGGTAVVVAVALSTGVAAAYTGNLPDPVQRIAHSVIGAPAPEPEAPSARIGHRPGSRGGPGSPEETTSPSPQTSPGSSPAPSPSEGGPSAAITSPAPTGTDRRAAAAPSASLSGSGAASASPTSEPAPDPAALVTLSTSTPTHLVGYGTTVTLTGHVTASDGTAVPGHRLTLRVRTADGWRPLLRTTTDSAGYAVAQSLPVTGLQRYRWGAGNGLRSPVWRVRVKPTLDTSYVVDDGSLTVTVAVVGAAAGDQVLLVKGRPRRGGKVFAQTVVDDSGVARFDLPTPQRRRAFAAWLPPTRDHAGARDRVVVRRTAARPTPAASPTPSASP